MDDTINTAQNVVSENDLIIENLSASPKNDDGYFGIQENVTENTITNVEANQTNVDIQNENISDDNGISDDENISDDNGISDDESNQGTEIAEEVKLQEITQEENQEENQEVIERELTEDEKLALELKQVNEELATLEAEIEKGEVVIEVNNLFDTQEGADEVGVSGVYDDYKREILDDVFENRLRMSVNDIKLAYSKIKNGILSYKATKQRYCGVSEIFTLDKKAVFQLEIDDDCIKIYFVYEGELNKDEYRYSLVSDKAHKDYGYLIKVKRGSKDKKYTPIDKAISLIDLVITSLNGDKKKVYVPTAYAERYPINSEAVLKGKEHLSPIENQYDGEEYDPIENELTRNIIEELLGENFNLDEKKGRAKLEGLRQQATTIKGAVALTEPIVYFFNAGVNKDNTVAYVNIQQVLNDKFLGKLLPQQFFAVAENSERIEELNLIALNDLVETFRENEKVTFVIQLSCRTFARKNSHAKLLKFIEENALSNIVFAFDIVTLDALAKVGKDGIEELHNKGVKIMLDLSIDVGLHVLTDYAYDYLRLDSRYYLESDVRRTALLDMIVGYAQVQGITTIISNVDINKTSRFYIEHGIDVVEGFGVSEPNRNITTTIKGFKKVPIVS